MSAGSPPDLVLDLTNSGLESEAVKSLTRDLGLPTLTTSMGGLGDIREWAGLSEQQSRYLVQVRGPHDLYQHIMWDLAHSTSLSTAAILYIHMMKHLVSKHINNFRIPCLSTQTSL